MLFLVGKIIFKTVEVFISILFVSLYFVMIKMQFLLIRLSKF